MAEPYLTLTSEERGEALGVAATASGRPVYLLEKDIWVVWALSRRPRLLGNHDNRLGTVIGTSWSEVTIAWDDGEVNSVSHNDLAQVERVP